jgi:hypothetical protein
MLLRNVYAGSIVSGGEPFRQLESDFVHFDGPVFDGSDYTVIWRQGKLFLVAVDEFYWSEIYFCPRCGFGVHSALANEFLSKVTCP